MIVVTRENDKAVVQPRGEDVVAAHAPELRARLREALAEGAREIVLDLGNVQMVDSTGIGLLIATHNSLRKVGGSLAVIHASGELLDLFQSMRIHQHVAVSGLASRS
jgi:anti-anti-sigma factor